MKKLVQDARIKKNAGEKPQPEPYFAPEHYQPEPSVTSNNLSYWEAIYSKPSVQPKEEHKPISTKPSYSQPNTQVEKNKPYPSYTTSSIKQTTTQQQVNPRPIEKIPKLPISEKKLDPAPVANPASSGGHFHPYGNTANCPVCNKGKPPKLNIDYEALFGDDDEMSVGFTELMEEITKYEKTEHGPGEASKVSHEAAQIKSERGNATELMSKGKIHQYNQNRIKSKIR